MQLPVLAEGHMLTSLTLTNFRCLSEHTIHFQPLTILVGKNNAGKSTIVEALRLVSLAAARYGSTNFNDVPDWLDIPRRYRGFPLAIENMQLNLSSVFNYYGPPPARITADFDTRHQIDVYVGPESRVFAILRDEKGRVAATKSEARRIELSTVSTLPQIGPLLREEGLLSSDYVRHTMQSPLASLHFRNELFFFYEYVPTFVELAESTWSGLEIKDVELSELSERNYERFLSLLVRDRDFTAEVGWMGHDLQMWLQSMWFLARMNADATVILDEPDVYMHADLQRRLIRLLRGRHRQTIVSHAFCGNHS